MDTAHLFTAFDTDDTVQCFKSQTFSKSVFLMRYRGQSDSKIFFTYDLRLENFAAPVEETKDACTFIPLPMVKHKHKTSTQTSTRLKSQTAFTGEKQARIISMVHTSLCFTAF
ncbi:MOXD2 protein, partial [Scytalopus superciliaris]|nr:MOXD2 protein [Scytalopus superciliaris]